MSDTVALEKPVLSRVPFGVAPEELLGIVRRDGGVVIEGVLNAEQVAAVNAEMDEAFANEKPAGELVGEDDPFYGFLGDKTKRVTNVYSKSKTFRDNVIGNPTILAYVKAVMGEAGEEVCIMGCQGMGLMAGQAAQVLHRDQQFPFLDKFGKEQPCVLSNMMLALVDFTDEIGATRVIPGSHQWDDWHKEVTPEMSVPAEMKAGDIFFFDGRTIHGGGENRTKDTMRRSIATGFITSLMSFAAHEEASVFSAPIEDVKTWPKQVQKMLGFRSHVMEGITSYGSWVVDHKLLEEVLGLDD